MADQPSVFISYSHLDREWKDRFVRHLDVSVQQGHFVLWNDEQIGAGKDWYAEISAAMDAASVGVFLISADFLGSDFISARGGHPADRKAGARRHACRAVYLHKCDWEGWKPHRVNSAATVSPSICSGTYLHEMRDGDVRRRSEVSLLEEDAEHGGHARRHPAALAVPCGCGFSAAQSCGGWRSGCRGGEPWPCQP